MIIKTTGDLLTESDRSRAVVREQAITVDLLHIFFFIKVPKT